MNFFQKLNKASGATINFKKNQNTFNQHRPHTTLNWHIIFLKMENYINKLSSRELSLMGKSVILNTLILSKTAYLSNIFPIPQEILIQIHKYLNTFVQIKTKIP